MIINETYILTIIIVSLKILQNTVDYFHLRERRFVNTIFIYFNKFDNMSSSSSKSLLYVTFRHKRSFK